LCTACSAGQTCDGTGTCVFPPCTLNNSKINQCILL
jgi:hypothetical protein